MQEQLTNLGGNPALLLGAGAVLVLLLIALALLTSWLVQRGLRDGDDGVRAHLVRLMDHQAQMQGALGQIAQNAQGGQSALHKTLNERLDAMSKRLGDSLEQNREKTGESLKTLAERLALIDRAQKNIKDLSNEVSGLQAILANKQSRGAFGEMRMQDLVEDALPKSAFDFQHTLSNGKCIDCLIHVPNSSEAIAVDAKFPLESYQRILAAPDPAARNAASSQFRRDVEKHIKAIASKYLLPGETTDTALMFLPSEAIYAELYANFPDLVQKGFGARVMIVSPTTFMAALHTISSLLKGARMREQAALIQKEVEAMLKDVERLEDRTTKLGKRFRLTEGAVDEILKSTAGIVRHAGRIGAVDVGEAEQIGKAAGPASAPPQITKS